MMPFVKKKFVIFSLRLTILLVVALSAGGRDVALSQVQPQPSMEQMVRQDLQRLRQRIESAREILRAYDHAKAQELLKQAESMAQNAHHLYQQHRFREARTQIQMAFRLIDQAIRMALEGPIKRYANQLESLMRMAESTVLGSGNREAERLVQEAKKHQQAAARALKNGEYAQAVEAYWMAIQTLERAIKMVHSGMAPRSTRDTQPTDMPHTLWSRFEDLALRVHDTLQQSDNPQARTIYEQAIRQARKAEAAYRGGNQVLAENLLNGAYRLLLRALDMASSENRVSETFLRQEMHTLELLLGRAGELPRSQASEALLVRARELYRKAQEAMAGGQFEAAQGYLKLCRGMLMRILREQPATGPQQAQRVTAELQAIRRQLENVATSMRDERRSDLQMLFGQARRAADQAEAELQQGDSDAALQHILVAQRLLDRLSGLLTGQPPQVSRQRAVQKVAALRDMIQRLESDLEPAELRVRPLLEQARELLDLADQQLQQNHVLLAFELADVGIDLLKRAARLTRQD